MMLFTDGKLQSFERMMREKPNSIERPPRKKKPTLKSLVEYMSQPERKADKER